MVMGEFRGRGRSLQFSYSDDNEDVPDVICDIVDCSITPTAPKLNPFGDVTSALLRIKAVMKLAWFDPSPSNIFLLPSSATVGSKINVPNENPITFGEASTRHINSSKAKYPDVDLDEDPEAVYGTDYRNMCGIHDETGKHDPVMVLCVAITLRKDQDDGVDGIILQPSEVESENNIFRRIVSSREGEISVFKGTRRRRSLSNEFISK